MLARVVALALNTYREAARARLLLGVLALSLATCAYALVVAALSLHNEVRVVADLGAASMSLFGVVVAVLLGSTSLYRELELKTIFPILSRPVRRWEYLVAKYLGMLLTVAVFTAVDAAAVFASLAVEAGQSPVQVGAAALGGLAVLGALLVVMKRSRVYVAIPWGVALSVVMWALASPAGEDRQLVLAAAGLSLAEVAIVAAVATLFASFSSPVLTATFTTMVFIIGRSSDTLAHLPRKLFGETLAAGGRGLVRVIPNLHAYVPPRALLLGQVAGQPVASYVATAALHAVLYATALLAASVLIFRRRDFP